jgi:hypothetical protein
MSCDKVSRMHDHCQKAWTSIPGLAIDIIVYAIIQDRFSAHPSCYGTGIDGYYLTTKPLVGTCLFPHASSLRGAWQNINVTSVVKDVKVVSIT